jgi:peptidoglycan/LPS O-acetylase OafA/YrhL
MEKKISALDGIRGLAVLSVMMVHCVQFEAWTWPDRILEKMVAYGWTGVDLFFALSGFLITGILFDAKGRERFFSTFYLRRAFRIFPLYYAYLAGLAVYACYVFPDLAGSVNFRAQQLWYWLYAANFQPAFLPSGPRLSTEHLWSLAIEEQFYFIWPLIVWLCGRRQLMQICLAGIIGALCLRVALRMAGVDPQIVYEATPTRMDSLLMGCSAALLVRGSSLEARTVIARWGLRVAALLIAATLAAGRGQTGPKGLAMQTIGYTASALLSGSLVLYCANGTPGMIRSVFEGRLLRWFGRYSYALYMLHLAVWSFVVQHFPAIEKLPTVAGLIFPWALVRAICAIGLTAACALLSWAILESPALRLKERFSYEQPPGTLTRAASP